MVGPNNEMRARGAWSPLRFAMAVLAVAAALDVSGVFAAPAAPTPSARRIQLNAHDEPVRDVLLRLGGLAHLNVTVANDVQGNVNLSLHDATPDEAVHAVCSQLQLRCVRDGRTLSVYTQSSVVVPLTIVQAGRAAQLVRQLYPRLAVRVDAAANALVLAGAQSDIQSARTVITGIDVRDATKPTTEAVTLRTQSAQVVAERLRSLYPAAKITVLSRTTMLVSAIPPDLAQIKTLVAGIDAPTPPPVSLPVSSEAVKVSQRRPQDVARAVTAQIPHVRTAVSGTSITLTGSPDDVNRAKALIAQLDLPPYGTRYVQIYRIHNVDAKSVAALVQRSFPSATVTVDADLNALSVTATAAEHQRISDGIAQLDGTAAAANGANPAAGGGGVPSGHEVIQLRSIIPGGQGGNAATTPQDIGAAVQQALQGSYPDLRVTVPNGTQQLIVTGSPQSIRAARELVAELDVVPQSVVLDTEILELDENSSRNLGLQLGNPSVSTTFTEVQPTPDPNGNPGRLIGIAPFTRTVPIQFSVTLNLLISNGKARVLADPRITTLSGRTATIRAGDTLSILTTTGGGTGTIATQQLQSFQTGVTLDITPIVTNNGELTVALHPVVNSLTGLFNNIPEISTRDTQTTVHLRDNETLVIGGLIQENTQRTESKIPLLGSLPLIGGAFRNNNTTSTRNELIIVVTPHILGANGSAPTVPDAAIPPGMVIPTPRPLPTVPPNSGFPSARPQSQRSQPQQQVQPQGQPATTPGPPAAVGTPVPAPAPPAVGTSAAPTPQATPSALAQANVFTYGSPPPSTYAGPGDAPQIFYATLSPTVLSANTTIHVSAITSTNVQRLTIGTGTTSITMASIGPGLWQGLFSANTLNLPPTATTVQLSLIASRNDGQSSTIPIPVSVIR
jgi:type II secretory pathway component GspD/PulD (secretin)